MKQAISDYMHIQSTEGTINQIRLDLDLDLDIAVGFVTLSSSANGPMSLLEKWWWQLNLWLSIEEAKSGGSPNGPISAQ